MAKSPQSVTKIPAIRSGEGTAVDVDVLTRIGVGGDTEVTLNFDLNSAPVPTRKYLADVASVERVDGIIKLVFGQKKLGNSGFRSVLVIQMSRSAVDNFLGSYRALETPLEEFAERMQVEPEELTAVTEEPAQAIELAANFFASALANQEACIDFYHASPFAMRNVQFVKKLSLDPVVRVDIRLSLLISLHREVVRVRGTTEE